MRTIVIGDVHGCLWEFEELIDRLDLLDGDQVVCLGDFMDKGPYPAECVRFARERGFKSVRANHEEWHLRWRKHYEACKISGKKHPMRAISDADKAANLALSDEDLAWLASLPTTIDLGDGWFAAHGGFLPDRPISAQHPNDVIRTRWVRERVEVGHCATTGQVVYEKPIFHGDGRPVWEMVATDYTSAETIMKRPERAVHWADVWAGPGNVVYGHEAFSLKRPKVTNRNGVQTWGIDTGAAHGGHLTALVLPTMELVQVQAREHYSQLLVPIPP